MKITNAQIGKIHGLLPERVKKDKDLKASIVLEYTLDSSKASTKDLTFEQANALIVDLGGRTVFNEWAGFNYKKDSHRYILSLLQHAGWVRYDKGLRRYVADMNRFGEFLQSKKAPVNKTLNKMEKDEVSKTIVALEGVLKSELKKSR